MSVKNFKLYKPYGYLSQFINNQTSRKNKKLLGDLHPFPLNTMAIGRLDEDSEGLLLLTTSGLVSERVRSTNVEKEYFVQVDGIITPEAIYKMETGLVIGINGKKYKTLPCNVSYLSKAPNLPERAKNIRDERHGPTSWASITLTEGKFRQVKKMTASVGFPTLRLVRTRIGNEYLDKLMPGEIMEVQNFNL
jgi:23S rRNA pseudouridine2457 synthase